MSHSVSQKGNSDEGLDLQNEILKKLKPHEKLKIVFELHDFVRNLLYHYYKGKNPHLKDEEIQRLIAKKFLNEPKRDI